MGSHVGSDGKQRGLEALGVVHTIETDRGHGALSACAHHRHNTMIWLSKCMEAQGDAWKHRVTHGSTG